MPGSEGPFTPYNEMILTRTRQSLEATLAGQASLEAQGETGLAQERDLEQAVNGYNVAVGRHREYPHDLVVAHGEDLTVIYETYATALAVLTGRADAPRVNKARFEEIIGGPTFGILTLFDELLESKSTNDVWARFSRLHGIANRLQAYIGEQRLGYKSISLSGDIRHWFEDHRIPYAPLEYLFRETAASYDQVDERASELEDAIRLLPDALRVLARDLGMQLPPR